MWVSQQELPTKFNFKQKLKKFIFPTLKGLCHHFIVTLKNICGSRGGLMVSVLGSGSGGPGSSLSQGAALCS